MSKKMKALCILMVIISVGFLTLTILSSKNNFSSLLKASVEGTTEETNEVLIAARNYALDNMDSLKRENIISIKELNEKNYLTGNEIDPSTNKEYDETERVVIIIEDESIKDIYRLNNLFKNIFSCNDICYLNKDNYITFNNDIYQIIKIDKEGSIYITNKDTKNTDISDINNSFKKIYNSINNKIVTNVVSITDSDVYKSSILDIEDDVIVNTNSGYKLYKYNTNSIEDNTNKKIKIYPVIVLKSDITYESGDGTKFNPYILGE